MSEPRWETTTAGELNVGDRVRTGSGVELTVTRIDRPFFGREDMLKLVESTDERWLAQAAPAAAPVQVLRTP